MNDMESSWNLVSIWTNCPRFLTWNFMRIHVIFLRGTYNKCHFPVENVMGIFSCLFDGSLVENETKSYGNPIIFLANAEKIP